MSTFERFFLILLALLALVAYSEKYKRLDKFSFESSHLERVRNSNSYSQTVEIAQQELLASFADKIHPGDPDKTEVYFVSFAGDSKQDVFMKESLYAKRLFDEKYQTKHHSAALINNRKTTSKHLVASNENLAYVLNVMGNKMNSDDVLYLYLTSHGSRDHKLSIDFPPHTVKDFGAEEIKYMLDRAGIKWRVVVVSACYSGGFVNPLRTEHTIIATASHANNTSFGCSDDRDFTYYGEAIFKRQMANNVGIVDALDYGRDIVKEMERAKGYKHSKPQLWIGYYAEDKLAEVESYY